MPRYIHLTPKGEKNYITPAGLEKIRAEYQELKKVERPKIVEIVSWAASLGDRSENADYQYGKKRLREIDRRLRFLGERLDSVEVVDPKTIKSDKVKFGATVTIVDEDDSKKVYQIVGADESEPENGKISWLSPIAKALMNSKVDDFVTVRTGAGERELEVIKIEYK